MKNPLIKDFSQAKLCHTILQISRKARVFIMNKFLGLTKRNLLIFFKDKQAIVFSLLTSIIVFVLYLLFLRDSFVSAIQSALNQAEGLSSLVEAADVEMYANLTLLVGILGSAMITVPFNCLTTVIKDRENKIDYDILTTPVRRGQIIISYFVSAAVSAILMTSIILTIGLLILSQQGDVHMGVEDILKAYGVVAIGSVSATALFMIVVLFFKTSSASGAFFGILSAAAGFVIGAYVPISQFSTGVQTFCNIFPASQITIVLRNVLLNGTLDAINTSIGGVDSGMFVETIRELFSFKACMFDSYLDIKEMMVYITVGIVVCIAGMIIAYTKTYKKQ